MRMGMKSIFTLFRHFFQTASGSPLQGRITGKNPVIFYLLSLKKVL